MRGISTGCLLFCLTVGLISGCGRDGGSEPPAESFVVPGGVSVTGRVTLDEQPLAGVTVKFHPQDVALSSPSAVTDENGEYRMMSGNMPDEALAPLPGPYKVTVTDSAPADGPPPAETKGKKSSKPGNTQDPQSTLPAACTSADTTGLWADITAEGPNKHDFQLKTTR